MVAASRHAYRALAPWSAVDSEEPVQVGAPSTVMVSRHDCRVAVPWWATSQQEASQVGIPPCSLQGEMLPRDDWHPELELMAGLSPEAAALLLHHQARPPLRRWLSQLRALGELNRLCTPRAYEENHYFLQAPPSAFLGGLDSPSEVRPLPPHAFQPAHAEHR